MACCDGCEAGLGCGDPRYPYAVAVGRPSMGALGEVVGDCDNVFPEVVITADALIPYRTRIGAEFDRTNAAVQACTTLSAEERAAWDATYAGWRTLATQDVSWFEASKVRNAMCAMARTLEHEREWLRQKCNGAAVGPSGVVNVPHDPSELASTLKWVAGAAIVVAGVYALTKVLP